MQPSAEKNRNKDLRNLGLVIFFSILAAFLLTFFFIYNYGPSGQYRARNVLLAPALFQELNYNDKDPKTNQLNRFIFDNLELSWYDEETNTRKKMDVDKDRYEQFYNIVASDQSIQDPVSEIRMEFNRPNIATLKLNVKTESSAKWDAATKVFQETQLLNDGNYYRVELHEDNPGGEHWAYFYHPHIFHDVKAIMIP